MDIEPKAVDLFRTLLPLVTFVAGIAVSRLDRWRIERRARRNIKTMFLLELQENFRTLTRFLPRADQTQTSPSRFAADHLGQPLVAVYEGYLGKLDQLAPLHVNAIYQAYLHLSDLHANVARYRELRDHPSQSKAAHIFATAAAIGLEKSVDVIRSAMLALGGNRAAVAAFEDSRGMAFEILSSQQQRINGSWTLGQLYDQSHDSRVMPSTASSPSTSHGGLR